MDGHPSPVPGFIAYVDHVDSPFYEADGLTPQETWNRSVREMGALLVAVGEDYSSVSPVRMSGELVASWHRTIFGELFPDDAGRFRRDGSEPEHVFFGALVGTRKSRREKQLRGVAPRRLATRIEKICTETNAAVDGLVGGGSHSLIEATRVAARLYAKLLRAHPWVDGNLRASFVGLNAVLRSLDLPEVTFPDMLVHDELLGVAFRNDDDPYRPLAEHIAAIVRAT